MSLEIWLTLAVANFVASVAPGQNVALVAASTARGGAGGGFLALFGILLAELGWCIAALVLALGARNVDPVLMMAMQVASGTVLIWAGLRVLRTMPGNAETLIASPNTRLRMLGSGLWVGTANPMALVFFLSLFPGFVATTPEPLAHADLVGFYGSAIVASAAAGLVPYLLISNALVRIGLSRLLGQASGGALLIVGASALGWAVL